MSLAVPEIALTDPEVHRDPFTVYGRAREQSPVVRLLAPGFAPMWALTRHDAITAMLTDPRFALTAASYQRPDVPADCLPYLRTMQEMEGAEHRRLRRLLSGAFGARRAAEFRPRIVPLVDALLDDVAARAADGPVDLLDLFARPLPIDVISVLVGVPEADRPQWKEYGAAVAAGHGAAFAAAIPRIVADARAVVARRRAEPADDLVSYLLAADDGDGDRLAEAEIVTLVWHLVLAGQTPTNLIANAVRALFEHPDQLALLRADEGLLPGAVEELTRWCGPQLMSIPRYAQRDVTLAGVRIAEGEPVTALLAAANRDPRVVDDPERLDVTRPVGASAHLGYAHGPHHCLGAPLARVQTEVALGVLLRRFPDLAPAGEAPRVPDPGTWRLAALPVRLDDSLVYQPKGCDPWT
ncbi:cytochrome P450 [Actinocatenispora rupis]|uniref:Cytochrome P450 n=1 Tax=Actinocatenispora rupis TaxID=519421 RepID=A0A8J3NGL9_9ACTN|nr:cytochrome P450 [Actinocatenispora rupis]GID14999.1 cytochrome P450 [Actinocatenispora rupis]